MNLLSTLALAATVVSIDSTDDELCQTMDRLAAAYPNHACAVFRKYPKVAYYPRYHPRTWISHIPYPRTFLKSLPVYICIPRSEHGEWLERKGDGGFDNWCFDPSAFNRTSDRLIYVV
ncbi:hypothetical protein DSO57_1006886 [Entomophthora muscae]|uniref:Uncharacterized protein n=1 Tax=Entomophthora muscae TaxID=34485 RepID=A0ACC2T8E1_9FUNG|nr:hypothetical protein DSO57_1006886 [Entomophthora muscae]